MALDRRLAGADRAAGAAERWFADDGAAFVPQAETLDLRRLLGILWRRKIAILSTVFSVTALAVLYVMQLTPLYVAEAQLVIEAPRSNVVDIEAVSPGLRDDWFTNQTEAAVIASRALAEKVVERERLTDSALFNPDLALPREDMLGRLDVRSLVPAPWLAALGLEGDAPAEPVVERTPEQTARLLHELVVDTYLAGLEVTPSEDARLVTVTYISEDPVVAAKLANAAAETYIEDQLSTKAGETRAAYSWLQDRAVDLQRKVETSARAVEEQRRRSGLVDIEGSTLLAQQLARFNVQLIEARGERAEAQARYEQVQRMLEEGGIDSAAAVLDSPLIQRLREQETEVLRDIAELKTQYREGHPKLSLAQSEIEDLRSKIEAEVSKIGTNLGNELEIARIKEGNLHAEVARLEALADEQQSETVTLSALETELDANQKLFDTILERLKETGVQDETTVRPDARIISYATEPVEPSFPRKRLIVGVAFLAATLLGVILALLIEQLDAGFRDANHVEQVTGAPVIGVLPRIGGLRARAPQDEVLDRPSSGYSEAIRTLRTSLLLSNVDRPPRLIVITSSLPSEGKTTTAVAVARTAAKAGQRAIVIDADLRNPSLHRALEVKNDQGLIDVLLGKAAFEDVVRIDFPSGAHFVVAGPAAPHPADLLGSGPMKALLRTLGATYDLVVIDTPPVLAVSDTLVLQRGVDKTVFVVRWEQTRRDIAINGLRALLQAGADLAGIVVSQVAAGRGHMYSYYGDTARYRDAARRSPSI